MSLPGRAGPNTHMWRHQFVQLLVVQWKLALREPYALGGGLALPIGLLVIFGLISRSVSGNVAGTGLTVIDLWTPTILVVAFMVISISLPSTLVRDREIGWLRRVSTTPVYPSRLLAAQLVINLAVAVAAVLIITVGGAWVFGTTLHVSILPFGISLVLSIVELFALGLVVVALAPSLTAAQAVGGVMFFALAFLAGLWVNPAQAGEPLATLMHYSPTGAAYKALLDAVFDSTNSYAAWVTMAVYTAVFAFVATRYFRWE